ncbi:MAG: class II fructose-bisphosphate aldolase, partial [Clostridia bacterium]
HLDHSITEEQIDRGLRGGYTGVMIDASEASYADNLATTKSIVARCHPLGVSVEAELGHVPDFDSMETYDGYLYTSPEAAGDFVQKTGADLLAVAVGTIHGPYRMEPKIRYDILEKIAGQVGTDCGLVVHGSSGITDEDYRQCIARGVVKFNIFTDYASAAFRYWRTHVPGRAPSYVEAVAGCVPVVQARCEKYLKLLGCQGKSWL